ncbi:MAG TPA: hypothetical protein VJU60_11365 [Thermoleophilaceae bacterium]|nr:hypothetical protein [Thermoleophilaceae bacterium]
MNLTAYRDDAEEFVSSLDREYYRHFAGLQDEFDIEAIYERHAQLFSRDSVERLREEGTTQLVEFAVHGFIGRATKAESAELARREAALEIEVDGERLPFRQSAVIQANEPGPERRAAIESARLEAAERELDPLLREALERSHALARELGWPSMRAMCEELSGIDLGALESQTSAFLDSTESIYEEIVSGPLETELGYGFERFQRADMAYFFRAPSLDGVYPDARLLESLEQTLSGLKLNPPGVILDVDQRPKKTPRAFCAPVRVPDEVYLVIARRGGRDDYETLFHEAGHAQHFAHMPGSLPMEHRYLGDNSITESFAFLFQHLTANPAWLRTRLDIHDPAAIERQFRAVKLVFLRRYAAKLAYELELHAAPAALDPLREVYARRLSSALHIEWPSASWLSDVDSFFYAAAYIRAWALETHVRRLLHERFGELWFEEPEAGEFLIGLWRQGQSMRGDELLTELTGARLDFGALLDDLKLAA